MGFPNFLWFSLRKTGFNVGPSLRKLSATDETSVKTDYTSVNIDEASVTFLAFR